MQSFGVFVFVLVTSLVHALPIDDGNESHRSAVDDGKETMHVRLLKRFLLLTLHATMQVPLCHDFA